MNNYLINEYSGLYFAAVEIELSLICTLTLLLTLLYKNKSPVPNKLRKMFAIIGKLVCLKLKSEKTENGQIYAITPGMGLKKIEKLFEKSRAVNWSFSAAVIGRILFILFLLFNLFITAGFMLYGFLVIQKNYPQ